MIEVRGLSKKYGPLVALRGINLEVDRGEFLTVIGPDRAGKTTLMRILATLARPTEGLVKVGGHDLALQPTAARRLMGFVSHQPLLFEELTAEENLHFYARVYGVSDARAQISTILSWVGLTVYRAELVRTFSQGMRQRLAIVRALLHDPLILLLDEPYSGLDQETGVVLTKILAVLRHQERTVVMTSHGLESGESMADRIVVLNEGQITEEISTPVGTTGSMGKKRNWKAGMKGR